MVLVTDPIKILSKYQPYHQLCYPLLKVEFFSCTYNVYPRNSFFFKTVYKVFNRVGVAIGIR